MPLDWLQTTDSYRAATVCAFSEQWLMVFQSNPSLKNIELHTEPLEPAYTLVNQVYPSWGPQKDASVGIQGNAWGLIILAWPRS